MALTAIQAVRMKVQDVEPGLYILSDEDIDYLLTEANGNVNKAAVQAAHIIIRNIALRGDETVDILSIKNSSSIRVYKEALEMFIKDPNTNPFINNLKGWVGGVSKSEMESNNCNPDNNIVPNPTKDRYPNQSGPFSITWRL